MDSGWHSLMPSKMIPFSSQSSFPIDAATKQQHSFLTSRFGGVQDQPVNVKIELVEIKGLLCDIFLMSGRDQGTPLLFHGLNWMRRDPIGTPPLPNFPFLFQSPLQISQDPPILVLLLMAASKYQFLL
jgi:hypothetical protein